MFFIALNFFADFKQDNTFKETRIEQQAKIKELVTVSQEKLSGEELTQAISLTSQLSSKLNSLSDNSTTLNNQAFFRAN